MGQRTILVNASFAPSLIAFRGHLLAAMVSAGHRVHASAPAIDEATRNGLADIGVTVHEVPLSRTGLDPLADLAYRRALRRVMTDNRIDLVLGYTIKPCIWGSLAAKAERIESVSLVTGLGYAFASGLGLRHSAIRIASTLLWRAATSSNQVVIFQNPDDRDDFIAAGALVDAGKAYLIDGSGVDITHYARMPLPAEPAFLMIARLLGSKGVREYGEAAAILRQEGCDARFALAGWHDEGHDGISRAELDRLCADGLDYIGPLEDVRPALSNASVFVLPSYREGTPRTVLEAMACGRPIITSDAPGCRETIEHGRSGLLVPPRDPVALAQAMGALAADAELRRTMADASFNRCAEKYAVERVNARMMAHLRLD